MHGLSLTPELKLTFLILGVLCHTHHFIFHLQLLTIYVRVWGISICTALLKRVESKDFSFFSLFLLLTVSWPVILNRREAWLSFFCCCFHCNSSELVNSMRPLLKRHHCMNKVFLLKPTPMPSNPLCTSQPVCTFFHHLQWKNSSPQPFFLHPTT